MSFSPFEMTFAFQLEELRADIVDLKEMYREQVNLLVNKVWSSSQTKGISITAHMYIYVLILSTSLTQIQTLS